MYEMVSDEFHDVFDNFVPAISALQCPLSALGLPFLCILIFINFHNKNMNNPEIKERGR